LWRNSHLPVTTLVPGGHGTRSQVWLARRAAYFSSIACRQCRSARAVRTEEGIGEASGVVVVVSAAKISRSTGRRTPAARRVTIGVDVPGVAVDGDRVVCRDVRDRGRGRLAVVIDDGGVSEAHWARRRARVSRCRGSDVVAAVVDVRGVGEASRGRRRGRAWCGRGRRGLARRRRGRQGHAWRRHGRRGHAWRRRGRQGHAWRGNRREPRHRGRPGCG
jgi:hypothetical protein